MSRLVCLSVAGVILALAVFSINPSFADLSVMRLYRLAAGGGLLALVLFCVKKYANGPVCVSKARLDGKVVVITGANGGIGYETALDMARRGAKVYLACRALQRGSIAVESIREATQVGDEKLAVMQLDLASLTSVRKFAADFKAKEQKLDILINNAGTMMNPLSSTEDGFEMQVGTNHLGHFLLTLLLTETLEAAAPSRVVTVSSTLHRRADELGIDQMLFDQYTQESYSSFGVYGRSKLYNILFSQELARRLSGSGVTTYSLHPGAITTDLWRNFIPHPSLKFLEPLFKASIYPFFKDPFHGAQTTIYAAVDPALAKESGKYYQDCTEAATQCNVCNDIEADAKTLWSESVKLVKLSPGEVNKKFL